MSIPCGQVYVFRSQVRLKIISKERKSGGRMHWSLLIDVHEVWKKDSMRSERLCATTGSKTLQHLY